MSHKDEHVTVRSPVQVVLVLMGFVLLIATSAAHPLPILFSPPPHYQVLRKLGQQGELARLKGFNAHFQLTEAFWFGGGGVPKPKFGTGGVRFPKFVLEPFGLEALVACGRETRCQCLAASSPVPLFMALSPGFGLVVLRALFG